MKRGAERQIQREDGDDPHGVGLENDGSTTSGGDSGGQGNSDISARPIRGLPKKKLAGGNSFGGSASSSPAATASSPFGGFGSFTSTNTTSANTSTAPKPTFSFGQPSNGFGASSNTTTSLSASAKPFTFSAPATAASAATASNGISSAAPSTPTAASEKDLEYYRALRGMNESLKQQLGNSIEAALKKDAFADLSGLLQSIRTKYEAFRAKAESKRGNVEKGTPTSKQEPAKVLYPDGIAQFAPGRTPDNTKNPFLDFATSSASQPVTEPKATTITPAQPSVSLPKPPASGGFSFAGSSFSGPSSTSSITSDAKLLPGQPTFALPKSGFFKAFGKEADEEQEGEKEDNDNDKEADNKKQKDDSASTNDASKPTSTGFSFGAPSVSSSNPISLGAPTTTTNGSVANPFQFSFGGNAAAAKPSAGATSAFIPPSSANTATATAPAPASPAPTFSFGQSSGSKTPSIGSNFANTSGVTQPGAFSFGSGKISFGSPSPSTATTNGGTGLFGNGNASSATPSFGSTGFTFGSRLSGTEKNDESEKKDDGKSS